MDVSLAKQLKALEDDNTKPWNFLAYQLLEATVLQELLEKMSGSAVKREAVTDLRFALDLSERRAFQIVAIDCTTIR